MKTRKKHWNRREVLSLGGKASAILFINPLFPFIGNYLENVDHVIWAVRDLKKGIDYIEEKTGVRAVIGGVHPGRGTRNALISLGKYSYLEIISTDPEQPNVRDQFADLIRNLNKPRIIGWAARTQDIVATERSINSSKIEMIGPVLGSRKKPNGAMLSWKTINLIGHDNTIVPFIIEWGRKSIHPSKDSPKGASLLKLQLGHPSPSEINPYLEAMGLSIRAVKKRKPKITATIQSSRGKVLLS